MLRILVVEIFINQCRFNEGCSLIDERRDQSIGIEPEVFLAELSAFLQIEDFTLIG